MRIKARWEAMDKENIEISHVKVCGTQYKPLILENGDTKKQLLARSRYLLFKKEIAWSSSQSKRAAILFREYLNIKKAYYLTMRLGLIYHQSTHADVALTKLARWYDQVNKSGFLSFGTIVRTIQTHYLRIVAFFKNRATNAASESFNAKIKQFRAQLRGVRDVCYSSYSGYLKFMLNRTIPQDFGMIHDPKILG
ncbi:transposase [uncultured Bacteroides sp.]|uniref:transposase n=1 Tax=uncultured Bacteroides sp. TaxID=162156 RepID=UPI002AAAE304|nr:transposase [uncultured Bacteroides sp.]